MQSKIAINNNLYINLADNLSLKPLKPNFRPTDTYTDRGSPHVYQNRNPTAEDSKYYRRV